VIKIFIRALLVFAAGVFLLRLVAVVSTWAPNKPVDELKARWGRLFSARLCAL
jgi:hypothetical protein